MVALRLQDVTLSYDSVSLLIPIQRFSGYTVVECCTMAACDVVHKTARTEE